MMQKVNPLTQEVQSTGALITKARRKHNLTREQLSKEADVEQSVIQKLELGKVDPWDVMVDVLKICNILSKRERGI